MTDEQQDQKKKRILTARVVEKFAVDLNSEVLETFSGEQLLWLRDTWLPALERIVDAECQKHAAKFSGAQKRVAAANG